LGDDRCDRVKHSRYVRVTPGVQKCGHSLAPLDQKRGMRERGLQRRSSGEFEILSAIL